MDPTTEILLDALKRAAAAHGVHEEKLGKPDAQHMARTLTEDGYRLSGPKTQ